jgi:hypothetical protein
MANTRETVLEAFFKSPSRLEDKGRRLWIFWVATFYLVGLGHWSIFFEMGQIKFNVHDWELMSHYLLGLEQAVTTVQLPLHVVPKDPAKGTERFLTIPDLPVSPQVVLIPILGLGRFVLVDTLLLFSLGFLGLYTLAKRLELSSFSFGLLFLLFSFNGHITAHLGVGHFVWLAYFLTPFVLLLILDAIEREPDRRWPVHISLVLFAIILQGGFHFAIWTTMLLVLLAITQPPLRRSTIVAAILTVALGAFRFIPAIFEFTSRDWRFFGGFQVTGDIPFGLASLMTPIEAAGDYYGRPEWWEVDYFVGFIGLGLLAVFGIAYWLRHSSSLSGRPARILAPALIALAFLSLDVIYRAIANLPIPFIGAERVSSRFLVLPFLFLLVFAVIALQRWLNAQRPGTGIRYLLIAALIGIALDLWQHSRVWRPSAAQLGFNVKAPNMFVTIVNRPDPPYDNALIAGAAVTTIALSYCVWRLLRAPKT